MQLSPTGVCTTPIAIRELPRDQVLRFADVWMLTATYLTDKDRARSILPLPLEPADEPLVSVVFRKNNKIDYLRDGSYNSVTVSVAAVYRGELETVEGSYPVVVWESSMAPLLFGSDLVGALKIEAEIHDPCKVRSEWRVDVSERGHVLAALRLGELQPLDAAVRAVVEERSNARPWLTCRRVDKLREPASAVSRVIRSSFLHRYDEGAVGEPRVRFGNVDWDAAPASAHVVRRLRSLPVCEYRGGYVLHGSLEQDVGAHVLV